MLIFLETSPRVGKPQRFRLDAKNRSFGKRCHTACRSRLYCIMKHTVDVTVYGRNITTVTTVGLLDTYGESHLHRCVSQSTLNRLLEFEQSGKVFCLLLSFWCLSVWQRYSTTHIHTKDTAWY